MADYCDFAALRLQWRPNRFLMLPAGFDSRAKPHRISPDFADEPAALFDRLKAILAGEPRLEWLAQDRAGARAELIQRSRLFRFPDRVSVAVLPGAGSKASALAVYSRAQFGIWDFGVNSARVRRWAGALKAG